MVLLGPQSAVTHRAGPSRRTLALAVAAAIAVLTAGSWFLVQRHNERPPWADDVAYESGFVQGTRVRQYDRTGLEVADLLSGGCERMRAQGRGGLKATYNPELWVEGCLAGAEAAPPARQGLFH
ncbi:hypothetical protein AB0M39_09605 [Streptomyces sp. NPDC051907]|uniref:hypothetical protein n=1 Tax=Streptomyces sp. NPDC051907 TaxID=3155284 RepID=UPI003445DCE4